MSNEPEHISTEFNTDDLEASALQVVKLNRKLSGVVRGATAMQRDYEQKLSDSEHLLAEAISAKRDLINENTRLEQENKALRDQLYRLSGEAQNDAARRIMGDTEESDGDGTG